ncbi:MAG: IS1 family transposase [Methylococcales bacterium]|nr:IS1 family transposase [Methylococcales bacterium]
MAYVFGKQKNVIFKELKSLLRPLKIKQFYTDNWRTYE